MKRKKEIVPIEKDKKLASEIKRDQKEFEDLFIKCVNYSNKTNDKQYDKKSDK